MTQTLQHPYRATCRARHREAWSARYSVYVKDGSLPQHLLGRRVHGDLYRETALVRSFDVALSPEDRFSTDIGTGSGVKVVFQHEGLLDTTRITVDAGVSVPLVASTTHAFQLRDTLTGRVVASHVFPGVAGPGTAEYHRVQRNVALTLAAALEAAGTAALDALADAQAEVQERYFPEDADAA